MNAVSIIVIMLSVLLFIQELLAQMFNLIPLIMLEELFHQRIVR